MEVEAKPGLTPAPDRLRVLDLLRFVAAIAVVTHHFTGVYWEPWGGDSRLIFPSLSPLTRLGYLGVDLFFVISGFVILMSAWGRRPGDFAVSRVSRLFPAYWFSVVLALVVITATGLSDGKQDILQRFFPNLTMLQEGLRAGSMENVYWSLWVELHFYALIMLLVWRGVTYARCMAFMAGWLLLGAFAMEGGLGTLTAILIPTYAPYFVAGMAFFLIYRFGSNLGPWLMVAICWALSVHHARQGVHPWQAWPGVQDWAIPAVITAIYLIFVLVATHRLDRIDWRGFTVAGAVTYPLYLIHQTVARPLIDRLYPALDGRLVLAIALATVLVAAYLVYRFIEDPAQRRMRAMLRNAADHIRSADPPTTAPAKRPAPAVSPR
ncbi:acyltransferase family protein [Actinomadura sp. 9N407]|uniref:acyltransferase family protein n=1 Tax=Actinomadura sp. 9N407 TaxID=3375154 RepID=UPI0037917706